MPPQMLEFTGHWRPYQAAVLDKVQDYLGDSKLISLRRQDRVKPFLVLNLSAGWPNPQ